MKKCIVLSLLLLFGSEISFPQNYALQLNPGSGVTNQFISGTLLGDYGMGFTFECWAKWDGTITPGWQYLFLNGQDGSNGYGVYITGDLQKIGFVANGRFTKQSELRLTANKWHHIAVCCSGSAAFGVSSVLDGVASSGSVMSEGINNAIGDARIGNSNIGTSPFHGIIDEVRFWSNYKLPASVRPTIHKKLIGNESGLIWYLRLDEGTGTTSSDLTSSANHVTLQNSPAWVTSGAAVGDDGVYLTTTTTTDVGPAGGRVTVTITSTPGENTDNLGVYQYGSVAGSPVTGETFPGGSGLNKRSNVVWGIVERGIVTANLTFNYSQVIGISVPSTVKIVKRSDATSSTWSLVTETSRDDVNRTITFNGVAEFSEFAIAVGADNPLPVELTSFTASIKNKTVNLVWKTATEVNNYGFEVQRLAVSNSLLAKSQQLNANSSEDWVKLGFVQGHGNSNSSQSYSFVDEKVNRGSHYYRLKQIDNDGGFNYSRSVEINVEVIPTKFELSQNYPNPFNPTTTIRYEISQKDLVKICVYDILGKEIRVLVNEEKNPGHYEIIFDAKELASGIYFYQLQTKEFTQTKKLILMK